MSATATQTELTYEEMRLLERLSWVEYLSDYDRIQERVLVNTGLAERLPFGRIRITDAGRVRHAALTAAKGTQPMTAARSDLMALFARYQRMTGGYPTEPWDQRTYDDLVRGLIEAAPQDATNIILSLLSGAGTKSAPPVKASHNSGERVPVSDAAPGGADTKSDGGVEGHAPKCEVEGVTVGSLVHKSARAEGKAETAQSNGGEKVRSHCFGEPRLGDEAALTAEGLQPAGIKPGPSDQLTKEMLDAAAVEWTRQCHGYPYEGSARSWETFFGALFKAAINARPAKPGPSDPSHGPDVREVVAYQMVGEFASPDYPSVNITPYENVANLWRSAGADVRKLYALTRPLGGFVQGSIGTKQSTDPEGSSRTETAGGDA